jgi:hypothetical protein
MKIIINAISMMLSIAVASLVVAGCSGGPREAGMVISSPTVTTNSDGTASVQVDLLAGGEKLSVVTAPTTSVGAVTSNLVKGNLVDFKVTYIDKKPVILVPSDETKTFNKILAKGNSTAAQFDSMKYGPELSPDHGITGNMVAAGWIYAKTRDTITVGDGTIVTKDMSGRPLRKPVKRYEETYKVAKDVAVYNVNTTDYSLSAVSDYASIPVTADYKYSTTSRQAVYVVFDKNYKEAEHAKVTAIYYFSPQSTSDGKPVWDVPTQSYLLKAMGTVPAEESPTYAGKNYYDIVATSPQSAPYTRSTEPFEIVKDTFYFVGDNEVAVYLFNAKEVNKLIVLDAGWPNSGYQYWKNIEAMGFDPRKVTDWMSTHGHLDHYGTAVELFTMIENAGETIKVWGTQEDTFGLTMDAQGNTWNISGALPASETVIRSKTVPYVYDTWMDYGNVQILVTPTPGHTTGTGSFIFKVKNPANHNNWVSFGYMGGYGYNGLYTPTASNGWLRLNFQLGLAWLQQNVEVDYVSPQHTNQYPIIEVYQALKAYNNDPANKHHKLTMLDALVSKMPDSPGLVTTEFVNFNEKRYSVVTNAKSDISDSRYSSLETTGPFKPGRENGLTVQATLKDGGKIIQGFNGFQNKNPLIPLLADGIQIITDSYVNDPEGWYVQFYIDVLDDVIYKGYLPTGHSQAALTYQGLLSNGTVGTKSLATITYAGGPVESLHVGAGTPEVLRTQRLNSKAEAEAILAYVVNGGTYTISLTKASAIVVKRDANGVLNIAGTFAP